MRAKKHLGQHFLIDNVITSRIIDAIDINKNDTFIEIGPGLGALTKELLNQLNQLHVIEIDRDMINQLTAWQQPNLIIHHSDVLAFDFASLGNHLRIIGNLPYNISSAILFQLFSYKAHIRDMFFMLQKEVAERINAAPGNKTYGRLSVMIQTFFNTDVLLSVPPESFQPPPKIDSAMLYLTPKEKPPAINIDHLQMIVRLAFSQRRKTLRNSLKSIITQDNCDIDLNQRAEALSTDDFTTLTIAYEKQHNRKC